MYQFTVSKGEYIIILKMRKKITVKGIYINVSRRNGDIPELIDEFSETLNRSKADTVASEQNKFKEISIYFSKKYKRIGRLLED